MLLRPCAGISIHGIATGDLTVNLAHKDCKVPSDILLACLDKLQDGKAAGFRNKLYLPS